MEAPLAHLFESDHECPGRLMDLQLVGEFRRTVKDGAGSVELGNLDHLDLPLIERRPGRQLDLPGGVLDIPTPQDDRNEGPGMIVVTVVIRQQDLVDLDRKKPAAEERVPDQVRLFVLPADNLFFEEFHNSEMIGFKNWQEVETSRPNDCLAI